MKNFFTFIFLASSFYINAENTHNTKFVFNCNDLGFHLKPNKEAQKRKAQDHCNDMVAWLEMAQKAAFHENQESTRRCLAQANEHLKAAMHAIDPVEVAGIAREVYDHARQYNGQIVKEEEDNAEFVLQLRTAANMIKTSPTDTETQKQLIYIAWQNGFLDLEKIAHQMNNLEKIIYHGGIVKSAGAVITAEYVITKAFHRLNKTEQNDLLSKTGITRKDLEDIAKHAVYALVIAYVWEAAKLYGSHSKSQLPLSQELLRIYEMQLKSKFNEYKKNEYQS